MTGVLYGGRHGWVCVWLRPAGKRGLGSLTKGHAQGKRANGSRVSGVAVSPHKEGRAPQPGKPSGPVMPTCKVGVG